MGTPRTVVSSAAVRMNSFTGVAQRIISSTAVGISSGFVAQSRKLDRGFR